MERISWPLINDIIKKYGLEDEDFDMMFFFLIDDIFLGKNVDIEAEARLIAFKRQLTKLLE